MNTQHNDFIHEIEEELKWEQLKNFGSKYGLHVIMGIFAIILGASGYIYWNHHQMQLRHAESRKLATAIQSEAKGQPQEALDILKKLGTEGGTYGMLAKFQRAAILVEKPETKEDGIAIYREMIQQRNVDRRYRDLAIIFYVQVQLDTGDVAEMRKLLQEAYAGVNMWPDATAELTALVALRAGDKEQAISILKGLVESKTAVRGIKMRAEALLQSLGEEKKDG